MTPFAAIRSSRPIGVATLHRVEGGLWQARCVCRWHGERKRLRETADVDAAHHALSCGLCVIQGRDYMDRCSCANCQRRRAVLARIQIAPKQPPKDETWTTSPHDTVPTSTST